MTPQQLNACRWDNLAEMERVREAYWLRYSRTAPIKLRWRAITVRHCFHVLPGESILELGAGSGLWTRHLAAVLGGECPITAATFGSELAEQCRERRIPCVKVAEIEDLAKDLKGQRFDYIVGTDILGHEEYEHDLGRLHALLKPGGQILFFEANFRNPLVMMASLFPAVGRWVGNAGCQRGIRMPRLKEAARRQGFVLVEVLPFDILHPRTPRRLIRLLQGAAFLVEHTPVLRALCGTLFIWAKRPGEREVTIRDGALAWHRELFGSTSVVVPCHDEAMNVEPLVAALVKFYGPYLHEIVIVDDNSRDDTARVARRLTARDARVRLVRRTPPRGVGRALRDGYAAATGRYILTMDADFVLIVPELRDLFEAIAAGHDGAIGSRFSYDSVLINYPFFKILSNRAFHLLVKLLLLSRVRDISNNLKLYRAPILKDLQIEEPHFAANVETGLKPLLAGYDIVEVPVSWIDRTSGMGTSSFRTASLAPGYFVALVRMVWGAWRKRPAGKAAVVLERTDPGTDR